MHATLQTGDFIFGVTVVIVLVIYFFNEIVKRKNELVNDKRRFIQAVEIIAQHTKELAIRRKQLVIKGRYGQVETEKWEKEKHIFLAQIIESVSGKLNADSHQKVLQEIERAVNNTTVDIGFTSNISPVEYEHFIADALEQNGWAVRLTKATGDQGVDIVAEKSGKRIAIQCKLYSNPVGNAAVQEIIAGRTFENAQFAAVVTNNTYTLAAKQLAASAGVLLLHHDQIPDLEFKLNQGANPAFS